MGDGTEQNPYTREDVLRLIKENGGTAEWLDLSGKVFEEGIDLRELDLGGINLNGAHLEGAKLVEAHLEGARLEEAHLEGVRFGEAHLEGANLWSAHLEGANLVGTNLEKANLSNAYLEGAWLGGARLEGAHLSGVEFTSDTKLENIRWGNFILGEERAFNFAGAADTYRRLKQWHTNADIHDKAAKFYYREKEAARKGTSWRSRHRWSLQASYLVFGHGEGWKRLLCWVAGFIFLFASIYFVLDSAREWRFFGDYIYFSVVSFTALGYGSWLYVTNMT